MLRMKINDNDFAVAIQSLSAGDFEQAHRCAVEKVVLSGGAPMLIKEVVARLQRAEGDDEHSVQQLMTNLEAFAGTSPLSARILMASLWPIASGLLLHDVCDAIDLWIVNEISDDLRRHLRQMMKSEREDSSRAHLERLLQNET